MGEKQKAKKTVYQPQIIYPYQLEMQLVNVATECLNSTGISMICCVDSGRFNGCPTMAYGVAHRGQCKERAL